MRGKPAPAMDFEHLECFVAVAEDLHFGRAARRLHRSPSVVSRLVKDLERDLRTPLFVRKHHVVSLTHAGTALLPHAREVLARAADLGDIARAASTPALPVLRFGATHVAPAGVVDLLAVHLRAALPTHEVRLELASSRELVAGVRRGELDLAAVHLPAAEPGVEAQRLLEYRWVVIVPSDDELAERAQLRLTDLAGRRTAVPAGRLHPEAAAAMERRLTEAGVQAVPLPDADMGRLVPLVAQRDCVAVLPDAAYGGRAAAFTGDRFRHIPLPGAAVGPDLGLVWRSGWGPGEDRASAPDLARLLADRLTAL